MEKQNDLLDALWAAALAGDGEAAAFLNMFGPWAIRAAIPAESAKAATSGGFRIE